MSVLANQCWDQRIPDKESLIREAQTWEDQRNPARVKVDWQLTTADVRIKLKRLYPVPKERNPD